MQGLLCPVVTPFGADLSPDPARFIAHCRWLLDQGCSGLAVFGTTSEANSLSVDERIALFDALVAAGVPAARLLPGTGCCALTDSARLTRHVLQAGAAGVLVLPPFYYKNVSEEGLFRSYAAVIERVADPRLRLYLYHIPAMTQVPVPLPVIERLRAAFGPTVAGIKDSSGDAQYLGALLDRFAGTGFGIFPASESLLLSSLRRGAAGCITASANVNPGPIAGLIESWRAPGAEARQARLDGVRKALQALPLIPAVKATLALYSGDEAWSRMRPPLVELDAAQRASLSASLSALGFSMPGVIQAIDAG